MTPQEMAFVQQQLIQLQQQLQQQQNDRFNNLAASFRRELQANQGQFGKQLGDLATIAQSLAVSRSYGETDTGVVRIEDLPGRRVPFDYLVDIPIGNDITGEQTGTITISQEGPFVAVGRYMAFQSTHQFRVDNATFSGRSYGRYRPIHSAWDLLDGKSPSISFNTTNPFTTGQFWGAPEIPGSMSDFRTMEFDARIELRNAGSSFPRQNMSVPSVFWTSQINSIQKLGCLDFYERGEAITFAVQPLHSNNPPFGNVEGVGIFGAGSGWPFLEGQYDRQEGILTADAAAPDASDPPVWASVDTDPVVRIPSGIVTIGLFGYRIQQPIGPVR